MIRRDELTEQGDVRGRERRLLPAIATFAAAVAIASLTVASGQVPVIDQVLGNGPSGPPAAQAAPPTAQPSATQTTKKLMWGPVTYNGTPMFPIYRDLGVGIYGTTAHWDQIATTRPVNPTDPNDPAYTWPSYIEEAVAQASSYGLRIQILIRGTPSWANGGRGSNYIPTQISDWTNFVTAVAKKYPTVNLWMIWGEPNRGGPTFAPFTRAKRNVGKLSKAEQVAPRNYAQLLDAAYGALKAISPANLVIGGNTYTAAGRDDINTFQWIRYMKLPSGARPRMDMYGHNPYGFDVPNLKDPPSPRGNIAFADLRRLVKFLDKVYRGQRLKLYLSEWGVPIGFKDKDLLYSLKPKEGKKWIRAGFRIARWGRIYTLGWVHPIDGDRASQGLLNPSLGKKPGYNAYKNS